MKLDFNKIKHALLNFDTNILSPERAKMLLTAVPSTEEIELIKSFNGDFNKLDTAEKFVYTIQQVPRPSERLQCFYYTKRISECTNSIKNFSEKVINTCHDIIKSIKFSLLLELVLAVGNVLNSGSFKGGAFAFKIDLLPKLIDTRTNRNTCLLNFIIELLTNVEKYKSNSVIDWTSDLYSVSIMERGVVKVINSDLIEVKKMIDHFEVEREFETDIEGDCFGEKLVEILENSKKELKIVEEAVKNANQSVSRLIAFFGEDPDKVDFDYFIDNLSEFRKLFLKVVNDFKKNSEIKEKRNKVSGLGLGSSPVASRSNSKIDPMASPSYTRGSEGPGLLDSLLGELKSGKAFARRREVSL
ncbi:hypothetical protein RCL1_007556 [Eukaryota sp. TZLM3-RCL]